MCKFKADRNKKPNLIKKNRVCFYGDCAIVYYKLSVLKFIGIKKIPHLSFDDSLPTLNRFCKEMIPAAMILIMKNKFK